ncbi:MAG: hypothetical protein SFY32_13355 [Bacteroidota bacterium]|nr:hypothetical protein [Bacteroidota bacterium]
MALIKLIKLKKKIEDNLINIIFSIVGISYLLYLIYLLHNIEILDSSFKITSIGNFGDTIGGLINPLLTLISILFLLYSFNEQRKANKIQWDQLNEQKIESENERKYRFINDLIINYENRLNEFESTDRPKGTHSIISESRILYNLYSQGNLNIENTTLNVQFRTLFHLLKQMDFIFNLLINSNLSLYYKSNLKDYLILIYDNQFHIEMNRLSNIFKNDNEFIGYFIEIHQKVLEYKSIVFFSSE